MTAPVPSVSPISPPQPADLLIVDAASAAATFTNILRGSYRVASTSSLDTARQFFQRHPPSLVVTELNLPDADGVQVCREAKALQTPLPVLVITSDTSRAPDALAAGCDGVLLKPFPPNLLFARIGRLLRARSEALRARARQSHMKAVHLSERSDLLLEGTNRTWPNTHCPYCNQAGATSFEFASHRRAWYACLGCRKVWIAKRQE